MEDRVLHLQMDLERKKEITFDIALKESSVHGKGIFAQRGFKKGELILAEAPLAIGEFCKDEIELALKCEKYTNYIQAIGIPIVVMYGLYTLNSDAIIHQKIISLTIVTLLYIGILFALHLSRNNNCTKEMAILIDKCIEPEKKEIIKSFYSENNNLQSIIVNNSVNLCDDFSTAPIPSGENAHIIDNEIWEQERCGLFTHVSRINHSCAPNICLYYEKSSNLMKVHALRDIDIEEELFYSYVNPIFEAKKRQTTLRLVYKFSCTCNVCLLKGAALKESDKRRRKMESIDLQMKNWTSDYHTDQTIPNSIAMCDEFLALLDEEGVTDIAIRARVCYDAFELSLLKGDIVLARKYAELSNNYASICFGTSSHLYYITCRYKDTPELAIVDHLKKINSISSMKSESADGEESVEKIENSTPNACESEITMNDTAASKSSTAILRDTTAANKSSTNSNKGGANSVSCKDVTHFNKKKD